jgi:hypothetical protein
MPSDLKIFGSPEKYVQGNKATAFLGEEMKKLGLQVTSCNRVIKHSLQASS